MTHFLIETLAGLPSTDLGFALWDAIAFQDWKQGGAAPFRGVAVDSDGTSTGEEKFSPGDRQVPVGTVAFVHQQMQRQNLPLPPPLNVPASLQEESYSGRSLRMGTESDIRTGEIYKSATRLKVPIGRAYPGQNIPDDTYQISSLMDDIQAEYRCFVYKGELVGLHYYSGDFSRFPQPQAIRKMIAAYSDAPIAYTLDVAVTPRGTFVVEAHHFYACGLYGFSRRQELSQA